MVFRVLLFKLFNRITTWELLETHLGEIALGNFSVERYDRILSSALAEGARIYSGAYIMPMPRLGCSRKHTNHLQLLDQMMEDRLPQKLASARTMKAAYEMLLAYESLGPFLAYQYIIDLNYSWLFNFSEMDFVIAGPGAVDGIRKCFSHMGDLTFEEVIQATAEMAATAFESRDLNFLSLWGRPLQLIDCQNLYCETDKYARLAHPDVKSRRVRLKRQYRPAPQAITFTYPSKWRLEMPGREM